MPILLLLWCFSYCCYFSGIAHMICGKGWDYWQTLDPVSSVSRISCNMIWVQTDVQLHSYGCKLMYNCIPLGQMEVQLLT